MDLFEVVVGGTFEFFSLDIIFSWYFPEDLFHAVLPLPLLFDCFCFVVRGVEVCVQATDVGKSELVVIFFSYLFHLLITL